MRIPHRVAFIFSLGIAFTVFVRAELATPSIAPGTKLESLAVGSVTYRDVEIRSVNARTLFIRHTGGMASVRLRDLSPELQARFGYDAAKDVEPLTSPKQTTPRPSASAPATHPRAVAPLAGSQIDALRRQFGKPATVQPAVDLRPRIFELKLGVKNQGRRPSCAIFAVVSALEFQNAEINGRAEKFSEEYLSWATRRITGRGLAEPSSQSAADEDMDEGFSLSEVVAALRGYGIPLQSTMPNTFGRSIASIAEPPPEIVAEAQTHQRVSVYGLPGHDNATRLNNAVLALNSGRPVVIGIAWPSFRALRSGFLSDQTPQAGSGHAVTLVGYSTTTGRLEDAVFIFKNSWGASWGHGGYGTVTFSYLNKHLHDSLVLDVQAPAR